MMSTRSRFILATLCALVLAGIVHIVTVRAIPYFAEGDAFSQARKSESLDHPLRIHSLAVAGTPAPPEEWLPVPDPAVAVGVCAYDLEDGPMRVSARVSSLNLSIAVHNRKGAFYAVTDQAAVRGSLDLVIMTRAQFDEALASADENQVNRDVRIIAPDREGFAVVRVIAGLPSQNAMANEAVDAVSCSIDAPDEPTGPDAKPGG
ncbi:hypothetical protein MMMDOFMJ_4050 [Methylobacterium gnaphalii]|nr:hypothetical protein MMMDOFMJ_4050 [Methylobacterium gnaphalii]